jgi:hypothetical protein
LLSKLLFTWPDAESVIPPPACHHPFSNYFWDGVLFYAEGGLNYNPPILHFMQSLGWQAYATMTWLRCESHDLFA